MVEILKKLENRGIKIDRVYSISHHQINKITLILNGVGVPL